MQCIKNGGIYILSVLPWVLWSLSVFLVGKHSTIYPPSQNATSVSSWMNANGGLRMGSARPAWRDASRDATGVGPWSFTAITFFISMILRLNVLAVIDASVLYPFHKIVNLAVLVGMSLILLGERLSSLQFIGLFAIIPAIYFLYDAPSVKKKIIATPFIIAAVSAFLSAVSNYSADVATQTIKVFTFGFFTYLMGFIFTLALSFFQRDKTKKHKMTFSRELCILSVVMGTFNFAGFCFFFLALSTCPLALVGGLNNLSLVVTILLSLMLLKESLTKNRLIGIGLSLVSLYICYNSFVMIHHIVLFQFKPGTTDGQIEKLADALVLLKDKMSGIVSYVWGPSVSIEHLEKGYTHGFILTFQDASFRDIYVPHPLHKELIGQYVDPICDTGLVFDIEE